jgi:hypothetical protein
MSTKGNSDIKRVKIHRLRSLPAIHYRKFRDQVFTVWNQVSFEATLERSKPNPSLISPK